MLKALLTLRGFSNRKTARPKPSSFDNSEDFAVGCSLRIDPYIKRFRCMGRYRASSRSLWGPNQGPSVKTKASQRLALCITSNGDGSSVASTTGSTYIGSLLTLGDPDSAVIQILGCCNCNWFVAIDTTRRLNYLSFQATFP